jgi:hypothetical protein
VETRVLNLEDIQPHVFDVAREALERAERGEARAERAIALALSAQALAEKAGQRATDAVRLGEIVSAAGDSSPGFPVPPRPRHAAKPRRDRSHLRVIRGGLAAFAPIALLGQHGAGAVVLAGWRQVWRASSDHVRWVAAAAILGTGTAAGGSLAVIGHAEAAPAAAVPRVTWSPSPSRAGVSPPLPAARRHPHHRHRHTVAATAAPAPATSPAASPGPSPVPSALPVPQPAGTPVPSPSVTLPPLPTLPPEVCAAVACVK